MGKRKLQEPQQPQVRITRQRAKEIEPVKPEPMRKSKSKAKKQKEDFVMILDEVQQADFQEKMSKFRERNNVSCVDNEELIGRAKRDFLAPEQEEKQILRVKQKILIEEEPQATTQKALFKMEEKALDGQTTAMGRCRKRQPIQVQPQKLEFRVEQSSSEEREQPISKRKGKGQTISTDVSVILNQSQSDFSTQPLQRSTRSTRNRKKEDFVFLIKEEPAVAQKEPELPPATGKRNTRKGGKKAQQQQLEQQFERSTYQHVIDQLQESAIPDEITCRDEEKKVIRQFLDEGLKSGGQSQALYISGVPGIGKTASVLEIKNNMQKSKKFQFIYVNGMNFSVPEGIYNFMLKEITGIDNVSRNTACNILNELFTKGHLPQGYSEFEKKMLKGNRILLLDECDYLVTSSQQVLYNLVDWPSYKYSKLTVVMIANTMDFPERLKPKLQSRLGNHRLVYKPYTSAQIEQIIQKRLLNSGVRDLFSNETLSYISKKIATISTDIRKTLAICRNAVEIARDTNKMVTIEHIKQAYERIYDKPYHHCLQSLNQTQKLLLISIALEIQNRGYNAAFMSQVYQRFQILQNVLGDRTQYTQFQIEAILSMLLKINLVQLKEKKWIQCKGQTKQNVQHNTIHYFQDNKNSQFYNICDTQIQFTITIDDLKNSFRDDPVFSHFQRMF